MGNFHSEQVIVDGIHIAHALEFADEPARLAYAIQTADIGKIVRQLDDDTFHIISSLSGFTSIVGTTEVGGNLDGYLPNPNVIDFTIAGQEQGSILYFDGLNWVHLGPDSDGYVLTTHDTAADPTWEQGGGGGDLTNDPPADVNTNAAQVGVSSTGSRSDHKHDIATAVAVAVGAANAEGNAISLARSNHTHVVTDLSIASQEQGSILYFDGANWVELPPGTDGYVLTTHDILDVPTWELGVGGPGGQNSIVFESALVEKTRSSIGTSWIDACSIDITTSGIYDLELSGVVNASSITTGSAQLRITRQASGMAEIPLSGYSLDSDGGGIFLDRTPEVAWGSLPFQTRLIIRSTGTDGYGDVFKLQYRNSNVSEYCGVGYQRMCATRISSLDTIDSIPSRIMRMHVDRATYAWDNVGGLFDWWSDAITGSTWLEAPHSGALYNPDGWVAEVDTVEINSVNGGFVGDIPDDTSNDYTFSFVFDTAVTTGTFRNMFRNTPASSSIGCVQSHNGNLAYEYGHGGTMQELTASSASGKQHLVWVFDKSGTDEVRVFRNGVEVASESLSGQSNQTLSSTNQGWFAHPFVGGFALECDIREVLVFNVALDTVTADWDALNNYVATEYSLDDRP